MIAVSVGSLLVTSAMLDALLFRPPTAARPEELVLIRSSLPDGIISAPDFVDVQEQLRGAVETWAFDSSVSRVALSAGSQFSDADCSAVSGNYFLGLHLAPARGRLFDARDDVKGAEPVIVLRESLARRLAVQPDSMIQLFGSAFRVIGTVADDVETIDRSARADAWVTLQSCMVYRPAGIVTNRDVQWLSTVARVRPGVSLGTLNAELAVIAERLRHDHPDVNHGMGLRALPLLRARIEASASVRILVVLGATVVALFVLGFTNFFSLTLVRLLARRREIAVRTALGSTPWQLARWILGELLAVVLAGWACGLGLSWALLRMLQRDPRLSDLIANASVRLDGRSIAAVLGASLLAVVAVWLLVLRDASADDVSSMLKETATNPRRHRAFSAVFAVQLAVTLSLAMLCIRFVSTLEEASSRPLPFRRDHVYLTSVDVRRMGWASDRARVNGYHQAVLARLRQTPGVVDAAAVNRPPLADLRWTNVWIDGKDPGQSSDQCLSDWLSVSDDYCAALGVRLLAGRSFTPDEIANRASVAMINQSMARRHWPGPDPLGRSLKAYPNDTPHVVIGVVEDQPVSHNRELRPAFYYPYSSSLYPRITYLIHVQSESAAMQDAVQKTLAEVWPPGDTPQLVSLRDQITASWSDLSTSVRIVIWTGALGLAVTAIGLYVFSQYTAEQRAHDAAIQVALGASFAQLARHHVHRFSSALIGGGALAVGLIALAAFCLHRFNVKLVAWSFAQMLIAVALVACVTAVGLLLPLRRFRSPDLRRVFAGQK